MVDIFAGSNTTGYVAEQEGRNWLAFEERRDYLGASLLRFMQDEPSFLVRQSYAEVMNEVTASKPLKKILSLQTAII